MSNESAESLFEIIRPAEIGAPAVFNSPHSGAHYPPAFLAATRLDTLTLRRSEDAFVDELFLPAVALGAPLMRAHFPRAFLDVNREPYELDPRMFEGRLPAEANTRSLRVAGGLGTIARVVGEAQEIYPGRLPVGEGLARIERFYKPYHAGLADLLEEVHGLWGGVLLMDCHSMPSIGTLREDARRPDIVLGDRYGTSCAPAITDCAEEILHDLGFVVMRNRPYAGGYITEHYGNPAEGVHALQIEISRGLYMDEKRHLRTAGFAVLAEALESFLAGLLAFVRSELAPARWAAE
jgi:N-formylglutamate amidohydrolase